MMMHYASAAVRQRTIPLSSSLKCRQHHHTSISRVHHSSPLRPIFSSNTSHIIRYDRSLLPSAQGSNGSTPPPSPEEDPQRREINLLVSLIVQYPAVRGSIAVALGYFAHIDPWGTFRWDSHDILIGCSLAIVPSLLDMIILLPNWEPQRTTRTMKLQMPREVAEKLQQGGNIKILEPSSSSAVATEKEQIAAATATASTSSTEELVAAALSLATETAVTPTSTMTIDPDSAPTATSSTNTNSNGGGENPIKQQEEQQQQATSDLVQVERQMVVRVDQHPLRDALQSIQMSRVVSNIGRSLSPPSEALLLFLVHVSEEMLYRGVILVLAVRWCTDNLYYAGVEESVLLPGGMELAVPQLGAILGGVGLTIGAVGLLVQRELFPLRLLDATKEQLQSFVEDRKKGDSGQKKSAEDEKKLEKKKKVVAGLLERLRSGVVIQQRWIVAVEASVEFLQWSTLSASFLLTGNILAPIAGSMVNDALYSASQRLKNREIKEAMKERASSASERAKQTADLLTAVREHRKNRLEPPKSLGKNVSSEEKSTSSEEEEEEEVEEKKEDSSNNNN